MTKRQKKHRASSKKSCRKLHLGVGDDPIIHLTILIDKDTKADTLAKAVCEHIEEDVTDFFAIKPGVQTRFTTE